MLIQEDNKGEGLILITRKGRAGWWMQNLLDDIYGGGDKIWNNLLTSLTKKKNGNSIQTQSNLVMHFPHDQSKDFDQIKLGFWSIFSCLSQHQWRQHEIIFTSHIKWKWRVSPVPRVPSWQLPRFVPHTLFSSSFTILNYKTPPSSVLSSLPLLILSLINLSLSFLSHLSDRLLYSSTTSLPIIQSTEKEKEKWTTLSLFLHPLHPSFVVFFLNIIFSLNCSLHLLPVQPP